MVSLRNEELVVIYLAREIKQRRQERNVNINMWECKINAVGLG